MGRRYSGRRKRKHSHINYPMIIGLVLGTIGIVVLVFALCSIVAGDTAKTCEIIGLDGNLLGCQTIDEYSYDKIAIVVGGTQNSPVPTLYDTAEKYINNSVVKSDNLTIELYSASSLHNKMSYKYSGISKNKNTVKKLVEVVEESKNQISEAIKAGPKADGAEYLETIKRAAKSLKGSAKDGDKLLMIVFGSGLSDGGLLDFTNGDPLHMNTSEILKSLVKSKELNNESLEGITILWTGIGDVVAPQSQLTGEERQNLEEIYRSVLEEMGAELLDYDIQDTEDTSVETNYKVKTIPTKGVQCLWCEKQELSTSDLGFGPDEWQISNKEAALEKLAPLISEMKANSTEKVAITGYAARAGHCGTFGKSEIPLKRANSVKQLLIDYGIAPERITVIDGGHGQRANECEKGYYDETLAQLNRYIEFKASIGEKS